MKSENASAERTVRLLRLYRSEKGIWHYDVEREGIVRWSSLRTRNESVARSKYERLQDVFLEASRAKTEADKLEAMR